MTRPITREQFALILPIVDNAVKKTRPRTHDLYDIVCAILERDRDQLTWRQLPAYAPPWRTVHEYARQWGLRLSHREPIIDTIYRTLGPALTWSQP